MTERPILFSAPMIRALLEGRKTQTRRVLKPVRGFEHHNICRPDMAADPWAVWWHGDVTDRVGCLQTCPYGAPGDRLWVKETLRPSLSRIVVYAEDGCPAWREGESVTWPWPKAKSVTQGCPRWASRLTLEITDVRVQRVQEISTQDAMAEGLSGPVISVNGIEEQWQIGRAPRECFQILWDSINAKRGYGWDANPWVWTLTFRRLA